VLVNCNAGQERAPLAVVWFLYKKRGMSFDAAYDLVKQKRLETQDRRQWVSSFL
jgi:protein-tyrosine phosphatase